jgi:hypothetical protein
MQFERYKSRTTPPHIQNPYRRKPQYNPGIAITKRKLRRNVAETTKAIPLAAG